MLLIAGAKAHSRYFSEDIYKAATTDKALIIIPNAVHVNLYDKVEVIPFDQNYTILSYTLKTKPCWRLFSSTRTVQN